MATRKSSRPSSSRSSSPSRGGGLGAFLLGVFTTGLIAAAAMFYFHIRLPGFRSRTRSSAQAAHAGYLPPAPGTVATSDSDLDDKPKPPSIQTPPAKAPHAPFSTSEDVFEAGARLYVQTSAGTSCATCHGTPNRSGAMMEAVRPGAAEFFVPQSAVTRSPSQLFLRTKYGVAGSPAMPAYASTLSDRQIWQIALLLSNAGQSLPDPVVKILSKHH